MKLTKEQKEAYLANNANVCPFCGSCDISGGIIDVEAREAWQNLSCGECHERWRDLYKLYDVETDDE